MPPLLSDIMCGQTHHLYTGKYYLLNLFRLLGNSCFKETKMCILFICVQNAVDQPWLLFNASTTLGNLKKKKKKKGIFTLLLHFEFSCRHVNTKWLGRSNTKKFASV